MFVQHFVKLSAGVHELGLLCWQRKTSAENSTVVCRRYRGQ